MVIHGDQDAIVPLEVSGKRTAASIPGAKLAVIKGGPHGLIASHPKEVDAALLSFLASSAVSSEYDSARSHET